MENSLSHTFTSHHLSAFFSFSFALEVGGGNHGSSLDSEVATFSALFSSKTTKRLFEVQAVPRNCKPPEEPVDNSH